MSKMAELYNTMEQDFERLSHTSMVWDEDTWLEQVSDNRFDGDINFKHELIFWFDSYASVLLAKNILSEMCENYSVLYDTATDDWALTTTLLTMTWRAN